jgi:hypothetical protein
MPANISFRPTLGQWAWAVSGIAIVVLVAVIAYPNLASIFNSQRDFVVGSLFSVAGFSFAKAFSRTRGQRALEALRDEGIYEYVSLIDRNIRAGTERLSEYHDVECRDLDFYRNAGLLRVVLDDLDKATANIMDLRRALGVEVVADHRIPSAVRLNLISVRRDLREALGRRDQAYEWLATRLDRTDSEKWDMFAVMTSDVHKAALTLDSVLSTHISYPPVEYVRTVLGYLDAALARAGQFADEVRSVPAVGSVPIIYEVMMSDLRSALDHLRNIEQRLLVDSDASGELATAAA